MRYAVLSDIHGNLEALSSVLDDAAGNHIERYACLGDVVGYGADPEACLARLLALPGTTVAGNHDWAVVGKLPVGWFNDAARRAVVWTRDRLGFAELDALRRLPLMATDGPCTLVHATLSHPDRFEYLIDLAQAVDMAKSCRTRFCLTGHTHLPMLFEYDLGREQLGRMLTSPEELASVQLAGADNRVHYVINPGSIGQPRDGDPRASYAILDDAASTFALRRVSYDIATAQRKIRAAGLPGFLADRLAVGR